jgi:autotransporter-associated beta strand protein
MKPTLIQVQAPVASAGSLTSLRLAALLLASAASLAQAATDIWTGGGTDSKWSTPANWQGGIPPGPNASLIFTNTVRLSNTNNLIGATVSGVTFATPSGGFNLFGSPLTLNGGLTNNQVVTVETMTMPLTLGTTPFVDVVPNASLTLAGVVSGPGFGLTKLDGGALTLSSPNTFGGPLTIAGGTANVASDANLGTVPATTTPKNIILSGNGGTLHATAGFTLSPNRGVALGPLTGSDSGRINVDSGQTLIYRGVLANNGTSGGLTKGGPGGLTLSGTNTYTGPTSNRVGTLTLDFTQATSPLTNIIAPASSLSLGGENAGIGTANAIQLTMNGKATAVNLQSFNGTFIDVGSSVIAVTNGATGGSANLKLGALSHTPGGVITFLTPTTTGGSGQINTTATNLNGILGAWALLASANTAPVTGIIPATNWASVDASGNIGAFTNFLVYSSGNLAGQVGAKTNLLFPAAPSGAVFVDTDNAQSTTDVNTITLGGSSSAFVFTIGTNNTLRLGRFGGVLVTNIGTVANNSWEFGDGVVSGSTTGSTAHQNSGTLTAGGAPNTPGELVFNINSSSQTADNSIYVEYGITDNGTGKVSVIKNGPGPMKFRGHNSFSGNMYILQGRIQMAGSEITAGGPLGPGAANTANPDAFGSGSIYVLPGGQAFPSGAGGNTNAGLTAITNNWFIAGNGVSDNVGAIRLSGVFSNGIMTLIGDARLGGGGPGAATTGNAVPIYDRITGPFNLDFGATGNSGGTAPFNNGATIYNQANDWSGNTTVVGRTGGTAGGTCLKNGANDVIPDGFGKGNMQLGNSGNTASLTWWDLNGFNETINGLVSIGTVPGNMVVTNNSATLSTLTIGNNDASGTFSGSIGGNLALVKIGGGVETLTGTNNYSGNTTINAGTLAIGSSGLVLSSTAIQVNAGATLDISAVAAPGFSTANAVNLNGGTLIGNTAPAGISSLTTANAGLTVTVNPAVTNIYCTTLTTGSPTNFINILSVAGVTSYPTQFTIIKYSGSVGGAGFNFGIGATPSASTVGYVSNDTANARVVLVLNNGPKPLLWTGNISSDWDVGTTTNWLAFNVTPAPFFPHDSVTFDDTASTGFVSLDTLLLPDTITVTNNGLNYTFTNSGSMGGFASLLKQGTGSLTLADTGGDSFSGGVTVSGGSILFATDNSVAGGLSIASGASVTVGSGTGTGTLPGGAAQDDGFITINRGADLVVPNNISGAGGISKLDAAVTTLSGANSFTGAVTVATGGTLRTSSGTALGVTNGSTTISSGATLDVNGQNLGAEPIIVSGPGVTNGGAIVNSGADQINALQNVTLTGNTTFGGTGRWDIRGGSSSLTAPGLSITKIGANQVSLVGASVDANLANINIQQGLFSIETTTSGAGAASGTLTVSAGATLQLYNLGATVDKNVVLNGDGVTTTLNIGNGTPNTISPSVGTIMLNGGCIVNLAGGTALAIGGNNPIGGNGSLTINGGGTTTITPNSSYPGATTLTGGTLILNGVNSGGGTLTVGPGATLAGAGGNSGPAVINSATVLPGSSIPAPGNNQIGTFATGPLTLTNASLTMDLHDGSSDLINVNGALVLNGTNTITPAPVPAGLSGNQNITVIQYSGARTGGAANIVVVTNPLPGYAFHLVDPATTPGSIQISVDHVPARKQWKGGAPLGPTAWDLAITTNWLNQDLGNAPDVFTSGDNAIFDDTGATNLVSVTGSVSATLIEMQNNGLNYTFAGPGKLTGVGELQITAGGTLVIGNQGSNDCTGPITILNGSLVVGDGGTNGNLGSGPLTNEFYLAFNRSDAALRIANSIAGNGGASISNIGPGVVSLSGNNANFFGQIYVTRGTLRTLSNTALGNTNAVTTTVLSGATLDVGNIGNNNVNLGLSSINVVGAGVANGGAIVNNNGSTAAGTNIAIVTMAGDTTFGGTGRLDFRSNPVGALNASLSTGNQSYKLTKVGTNQFQVSGVNVDPALGDIDVKAGILGIETGTTLGDPNHTLTVFTNATLNFFNLSNVLVKLVTMNDGATMSSSSGTNTFGGTITLSGSNTFSVTSAYLALANAFSGSGGTFVKSGASPLLLSFVPGSAVIDITAGTLDVTNTAGALLSLASGQTLRGSGTLSGNLSVGAGATVAPGEPNALGTLTVDNGSVTLGGTTLINLNPSAANSNSVLSCANGIALGGSLRATNIGPNILRSGDSFTVFSGPLSGSITPALPALWPGLSWNTSSLNSAGRISITGTIIPPQVQSGSVSGNNVTVSGSGGLAGANYYVLEGTNVTLPLTQWRRIATNTFDNSGNFSWTGAPHSPLLPAAFYTIQVP